MPRSPAVVLPKRHCCLANAKLVSVHRRSSPIQAGPGTGPKLCKFSAKSRTLRGRFGAGFADRASWSTGLGPPGPNVMRPVNLSLRLWRRTTRTRIPNRFTQERDLRCLQGPELRRSRVRRCQEEPKAGRSKLAHCSLIKATRVLLARHASPGSRA